MKKIILLFILEVMICINCHADETELHDKLSYLSETIQREQSEFPQGSIEDIKFIKEIVNLMYSIDQETRELLISDIEDSQVQSLISNMDKFHATQMKKIIENYGWLTISKFGEKTDSQAWLLVQHADHDPFFQAACAYILQRLIEKNETNQQNFAYLFDRVALKFKHLGMKQRYGTQVLIKDNKIKLQPFEGSIAQLNARRKEMGLIPVSNYIKSIKQNYNLH